MEVFEFENLISQIEKQHRVQTLHYNINKEVKEVLGFGL